jgi:FkbM family methyltransferase
MLMKKSTRNRLSKIINIPLNRVGLALVRTNLNATHSIPTWKERMEFAKKLGFSPRAIFDGGAFWGLWSQEAAQLFPGAEIVLIEPNSYLQDIIKKNISNVQPAPKIINAALGESSGKAMLNIWSEKESDTAASLLGHVSGNARTVIEVDVETIDNISQQTTLVPDLVKLDLQGGELSALRGATNVLKHAEFMIIEFGCLEAYIGRTTPRDLLEVMYDNNYCLYDIVDCLYRPYDGSLTGGDFFFVKNDSVLKNYKGWE